MTTNHQLAPAVDLNSPRGVFYIRTLFMLVYFIEKMSELAYTPDGGVADPNHPIYALLWVLKQVAM